MLKMAVFAPMPRATVTRVTAVNPGVRARLRNAYFQLSMEASSRIFGRANARRGLQRLGPGRSYNGLDGFLLDVSPLSPDERPRRRPRLLRKARRANRGAESHGAVHRSHPFWESLARQGGTDLPHPHPLG